MTRTYIRHDKEKINRNTILVNDGKENNVEEEKDRRKNHEVKKQSTKYSTGPENSNC